MSFIPNAFQKFSNVIESYNKDRGEHQLTIKAGWVCLEDESKVVRGRNAKELIKVLKSAVTLQAYMQTHC